MVAHLFLLSIGGFDVIALIEDNSLVDSFDWLAAINGFLLLNDGCSRHNQRQPHELRPIRAVAQTQLALQPPGIASFRRRNRNAGCTPLRPHRLTGSLEHDEGNLLFLNSFVESIKMKSKWNQNAIKMKSKCNQNEIKMKSKWNQNEIKMKSNEIKWNQMKSNEIKWNPMKSNEIKWNQRKSNEIKWNPMKSDEIKMKSKWNQNWIKIESKLNQNWIKMKSKLNQNEIKWN